VIESSDYRRGLSTALRRPCGQPVRTSFFAAAFEPHAPLASEPERRAFASPSSARAAASVLALAVLALSVAACADEHGDSAAAAATTTAPASQAHPTAPITAASLLNRAPSIFGRPVNAVKYGGTYSFQPMAHDPEGISLEFSIANRPAWAKFDPVTGKLRGTPGMADIGSYPNIAISVSDGTYQTSLPAFRVDVVGTATGSIVVSWSAPTERADGSTLTDLAGYRLYWGQSPGNYSYQATISQPGIATYVIDELTSGTYYLVATAYDSKGVESGFSGVFSKTVL
jgi:hypothetical protein